MLVPVKLTEKLNKYFCYSTTGKVEVLRYSWLALMEHRD